MPNQRYHIIELLLFLLLIALPASAQKAERDLIRKGNRQFRDSSYVNAEVSYRKALEINPQSAISMFNLGNTLLEQNKLQEAMDQYAASMKIETDKSRLAQIFHNMGVIFHSQHEYDKAIEMYKESLRNNPKDDETRYNLALAQKMLKDQEQNPQNQDQNQQNKNQEQDQNQDQNQNQDPENPQQQPPQEEPRENELSRENAEQLLNSIMRDEKDVQEQVNKIPPVQEHRLEKDW